LLSIGLDYYAHLWAVRHWIDLHDLAFRQQGHHHIREKDMPKKCPLDCCVFANRNGVTAASGLALEPSIPSGGTNPQPFDPNRNKCV